MPRICDCYFVWQKGLSRCDYLKGLEEISWDYPGGSNLITSVLIRGRQKVKGGSRKCDDGRKRLAW